MTKQISKQMQQINQANARILNLYCAWVKTKGINYNEFLMYYILLEGAKTQKELSLRSHLIKQTVNNIIQSMKEKGYVVFHEDQDNHKKKLVVLTQEGEKKAHEITDELIDIENRVVEKLGEKQLAQFIALSNALANTLEEEMK